jgi:hypothetical protein
VGQAKCKAAFVIFFNHLGIGGAEGSGRIAPSATRTGGDAAARRSYQTSEIGIRARPFTILFEEKRRKLQLAAVIERRGGGGGKTLP